jgi:hypothetical protein
MEKYWYDQGGFWWQAFGGTLNGMVLSSNIILVLLIWLNFSTFNTERTQIILNFVTDKDLCTITDKFIWFTALDDIIFHGIHKLLITLYTIDIGHVSIITNKQHSSNRATSTSGISALTMLQETGSCRRTTLRVGLGDLIPCF